MKNKNIDGWRIIQKFVLYKGLFPDLFVNKPVLILVFVHIRPEVFRDNNLVRLFLLIWNILRRINFVDKNSPCNLKLQKSNNRSALNSYSESNRLRLSECYNSYFPPYKLIVRNQRRFLTPYGELKKSDSGRCVSCKNQALH